LPIFFVEEQKESPAALGRSPEVHYLK